MGPLVTLINRFPKECTYSLLITILLQCKHYILKFHIKTILKIHFIPCNETGATGEGRKQVKREMETKDFFFQQNSLPTKSGIVNFVLQPLLDCLLSYPTPTLRLINGTDPRDKLMYS